jgi:hypothetical protein
MKHTVITCLACVALLAGAVPANADKKDKPRIFRMTVSPAPEPEPALKYRLLPRAFEQKSGNAALLYYRMLDRIDGKDDAKTLDKWLDTAPNKLPRPEVRRMLAKYALVLKELKLATRRDHCDWAFPYREEGFNTILPPLSKFRHLIKVLALRGRLEIAEGQFDKAVDTLQTGFTFARHQADGGLLICGLVGASVAEVMFRQIQAFSEAPGAPNLYWALASLGRPVVDIRKGLLSEADSLFLWFPALRDAKHKPMTPQDWHAMFGQLFLGLGSPIDSPIEKTLAGTAVGIKIYPHARKYLAGKGMTVKQIDAMPVSQAIATYMVETFEHISDDQFKWFLLPYHQAHARIRRAEMARRRSMAKPNMPGFPLTLMLPALGRARFHQARVDRQAAGLSAIESIRLHASANDGKLPAKLTDVTIVPVPLNPVTGRPFVYKVSGRTFTLTAGAPSDMKPSDTDQYEVTVTAQ